MKCITQELSLPEFLKDKSKNKLYVKWLKVNTTADEITYTITAIHHKLKFLKSFSGNFETK